MGDKTRSPDARVAEIAARQHGVVRTQQLGLSREAVRKRVAAGRLFPRYRGVYAVGHARLSREGEWMAAILAAGDGSALASLSAAVLMNITRFREDTIHVITPHKRKSQPGYRLHWCRHLDPRDITVVNQILVTTVARTLVDLTAVLTAEQLANVIHEAAYRRSFSEPATRAAMQRAPGRKLSVLHEALCQHKAGSAGTRSRLEDRFLTLVRAAGLPRPRTNCDVHGFEVDYSWPGLCVEVDGPGHRRPRTKADDRIEDAALSARGITVLRFTEGDIDRRPATVLAQLAAQQLPSRVAG
jgi:very-short-patch-repair endonuclease